MCQHVFGGWFAAIRLAVLDEPEAEEEVIFNQHAQPLPTRWSLDSEEANVEDTHGHGSRHRSKVTGNAQSDVAFSSPLVRWCLFFFFLSVWIPAFLQICCSVIAESTTLVLNEEVRPQPYFTSEFLFQPNFKLLLFYPNVTQPSVRRSQSLLQMAELLGVSDEHIHFGSKLPLCLWQDIWSCWASFGTGRWCHINCKCAL